MDVGQLGVLWRGRSCPSRVAVWIQLHAELRGALCAQEHRAPFDICGLVLPFVKCFTLEGQALEIISFQAPSVYTELVIISVNTFKI